MRGELGVEYGWGDDGCGSSPHAWGAPTFGREVERADRFIPTCVGSSYCLIEARRDPEVHPHMRGELAWGLKHARRISGSSPHAWGAPKRSGAAAVC